MMLTMIKYLLDAVINFLTHRDSNNIDKRIINNYQIDKVENLYITQNIDNNRIKK